MASTALIIGASRGLGLALAEEYRRRGWNVIGTVRNDVHTGLHMLAAEDDGVEVATLDTTDEAGIAALAERLARRTIDLLFVNAGISIAQETPIGELTDADFTHMMLVNALAPLRIVDRLIDLVAPNGTAAVMSSGLASISGSNGGWEVYRMTKAALNMGMKSLALRHAGGRTFLCIAPGWVRTDMGGPGATFGIDESIPRVVDTVTAYSGRGGDARAELYAALSGRTPRRRAMGFVARAEGRAGAAALAGRTLA
jgi:NAD(P)-dependent dehydrogenase (short-subunit alcohol dehydrogenase family)